MMINTITKIRINGQRLNHVVNKLWHYILIVNAGHGKIVRSGSYFRVFLGCELFKKLDGLCVDLLERKAVFGLVHEHHDIRLACAFGKDVLVVAVGFPQHPFKIIAVGRFFEVFFGYRNPHLHDGAFFRLRYIDQPQRVFRHRLPFREQKVDRGMAFQLFLSWVCIAPVLH